MATRDVKPEPFFVRLKRLAAHVEKETDQLEMATLERDRDCCVPVVVKTINDMTNDVKDVKQEAQGNIASLKSNIEMLDNLLLLSERLVAKQEEQLNKTEDYLQQYGYVRWENQHGDREVASQTQASSEALGVNPETNIPGSPIGGETSRGPDRPEVMKTPTLEGRHISQHTMQFLNSISKNKAPTWATSMHAGNRKSQTPQDFQHRGIIVTPSLIGSSIDNSMINAHEALASPFPPVSDTPDTFQPHNIHDPIARLQFDEAPQSPVAPLFVTPMFKTMFGSNVHVGDGDGKQTHNKKAVVGLFQTEPNREAGREPNHATFTTGFVKNEPQTPELTYSLEEMSEMTGMFSFKPKIKLPKAPSPPPLSAGSRLENRPTPEEPDLLSQRLAKIPKTNDMLMRNHTVVYSEVTGQNKENVTFEEPKLVSGIKSETDTGSVNKMPQYGDFPASPQFLGQYAFNH